MLVALVHGFHLLHIALKPLCNRHPRLILGSGVINFTSAGTCPQTILIESHAESSRGLTGVSGCRPFEDPGRCLPTCTSRLVRASSALSGVPPRAPCRLPPPHDSVGRQVWQLRRCPGEETPLTRRLALATGSARAIGTAQNPVPGRLLAATASRQPYT